MLCQHTCLTHSPRQPIRAFAAHLRLHLFSTFLPYSLNTLFLFVYTKYEIVLLLLFCACEVQKKHEISKISYRLFL